MLHSGSATTISSGLSSVSSSEAALKAARLASFIKNQAPTSPAVNRLPSTIPTISANEAKGCDRKEAGSGLPA